MTLGAQALGQFELGGTGYAAGTSFIDLAAPITITSAVAAAISIAGQAHIAADIAITSSVQASLTLVPPAAGSVNISATITMVSSITAALSAAPTFPDPGVSFSMTDKAGGA